MRRVRLEGSAGAREDQVVQVQAQVRVQVRPVVPALPEEGPVPRAVEAPEAVRAVEAPAVVGVLGLTSVPVVRSVVAVWMSWSRSPLLRTRLQMLQCPKARYRCRAA